MKSLLIFFAAVFFSFNPANAQMMYYPNGDTTSLAIGTNALINQSLTNVANVAVGAYALQSLTAGVNGEGVNTALGYDAGGGVGLGSPFTGAGVTAIGAYALGSIQGSSSTHNTAVGAYSMYLTTTGGDNTALGEGAGEANTTGSSNLFVGYGVGSGVCSTGSDNVLIGVNGTIDCASASESDSIHFGGGHGDWVYVTGINTPSTASAVMNGSLNVTVQIKGASYAVGATSGVSCASGISASTFRSVNGIVTHC